MDSKNRMNMCEGPLLGKIVRYTIPLFFTLILQLVFNAADLIVVGHFCEHEALAAVGSTTSLIHLLINLFFGLSIGTNVVAGRAYGAKDDDALSKTTHTGMVVAMIGGVVMGGIAIAFSPAMLRMMETPDTVIGKAILYMRIYFLGLPIMLVYNFGSAVMRAIGDTRRPLLYLAIAGIVNIPLNLFFVLKLHMDVDGVAWATVISQTISMILVWRALMTSTDGCRLSFRRLAIHLPILRQILGIGLPAAAQSSCFSLSNVLIQSSINSFGDIAMAGSAATMSIEGLVYTGPFAFHQATLSFVSQNLGGKKYRRIGQSIAWCFCLSVILSTVLGVGTYLQGPWLLAMYSNSNADVIDWGMRRMLITFTPYALAGIMDVISAGMRGLGHSLISAFNVLFFVCVFRVIWIFTIFQRIPTMECLMSSYPISWALASIVNGVLLWKYCRQLREKEHELAVSV